MKNFPPNISPGKFTTSAVILADILSTDLTTEEQYSIANWLQLVGQVMITNAGQQELILSRKEEAQKNDIQKC